MNTYSEKLKDPRWQKKRLEIFERDGWACRFCGDKETTLHVHHLRYSGDPWEVADDDLKTVCADCHLIIEDVGNDAIIQKLYGSKGHGSVFFIVRTKEFVYLLHRPDPQGEFASQVQLPYDLFETIMDFVKSYK